MGPAPPAPALRRRTRFIGLAAGLLSGVLNAAVARVLMRIVALIEFGQGSFSVAGTAVIFMFGLLLVVTLQVPSLSLTPEFMQELMAVGPLGFAVFGLMNFAFVLTLAALTPWLDSAWPRDESRAGAESGLTAGFGFLALCGLALLVYEIGGRLLGIVN